MVELTPIVFRAAAAGDAVARSIVDRQADEIVRMAGVAVRRLHMTRLDVDIVLGGGIFSSGDEEFLGRMEVQIEQVKAGERLRVEALGPGRIVLTRAEDNLEDLLGALGDDVFPPGYLEELRGEWD